MASSERGALGRARCFCAVRLLPCDPVIRERLERRDHAGVIQRGSAGGDDGVEELLVAQVGALAIRASLGTAGSTASARTLIRVAMSPPKNTSSAKVRRPQSCEPKHCSVQPMT